MNQGAFLGIKVNYLKIWLDFTLIPMITKKVIKKITEQNITVGSEIDFWKLISSGKRQIFSGLK